MAGGKAGRRGLRAAMVAMVVLAAATVSAHEGHEHSKRHRDAQMSNLHRMMPRYAKSEANISTALEGGNLKAVLKETDYLRATLADLERSKPHKNLAALAEYRTIAADFGKDVQVIADATRKGDLAGAKASFASAKKKCDSCHAKFRD